MSLEDITQLEIDLLLLFFTFSDQFGNVDIDSCAAIAKDKMGVLIPTDPFTLEQKHLDALIKFKVLPDVTAIMHNIRISPARNFQKRP